MGKIHFYGTDVTVDTARDPLDPRWVALHHVRCQYHRGCTAPATLRQYAAGLAANTCVAHQSHVLMRLLSDYEQQHIHQQPSLPLYEPLGVRPGFVPLDVLPAGHARDVLVAKVAAHTAYIDLVEGGFPDTGWHVGVLPDTYATLDAFLAAVAAWDGVTDIGAWQWMPLNEWAQRYR